MNIEELRDYCLALKGVTEDYVRLKTIAILINKNALPEKIRGKLNL